MLRLGFMWTHAVFHQTRRIQRGCRCCFTAVEPPRYVTATLKEMLIYLFFFFWKRGGENSFCTVHACFFLLHHQEQDPALILFTFVDTHSGISVTDGNNSFLLHFYCNTRWQRVIIMRAEEIDGDNG